MLSLVHISTILHFIRITSLITALLIVIGSLCLYSSNSIPLNLNEKNTTWIIQAITDRRLISTLVAAQASIFCPLFILLHPTSTIQIGGFMVCFVEFFCQLLMPLGLALSWMFSILFDTKTKEMVDYSNNGGLCLEENQEQFGCALFGLIHGLKYAIVVVFTMEAVFVIGQFIISRYYTPQIQLPLDDDEAVVVVEEEKN